MAGFKDFMAARQQPQVASGTTEPLDMGQGTRPRLTFSEFMEKRKAQPQVSPETVQDVTKQPVGRPASAQPAATQAPQAAPQEPQQAPQETSWLDTAKEYGSKALGAAEMALTPGKVIGQYVQEHPEEVKDWALKEAAPTLGAAVGIALAPETGGASLLATMAWTGGMAGAGAFAGEGIEQTAKMRGVIPLGKGEEAPKDGWDVLKRSAVKGGEEALWNALPEMLIKGAPIAYRKMLMAGGKPSIDEAGNVVHAGKHEMTKMMREYATKHGMDENKVLLASDVANVPLMDMAESISSNSYIKGSAIREVREAQEAAIKEKIIETAGQYLDPAKGYVSQHADGVLAKYIQPNMDNMNDFAIAGMVDLGLRNAQEAQKSVARSMYRVINDAMEPQMGESVWKEVEVPGSWDVNANGPRKVWTQVNTPDTFYPVDLRGIRKLAEDRAEESLTGLSQDHTEMLGFPDAVDYKQAANTLVEWKATSRQLERATTENAPVRKMHLDRAIKMLSESMDETMDVAHADGVTAPDGRSLSELKKDADAIWKEQVEDFQNSYVANILKKASPKNGAPEKLAQLATQNEMAANNIMKIIDDAKGTLQGDALEQINQAHNAIKGSIVRDIFMPFDRNSGEYIAPDVRQVHGKAKQLTRIFGEDGYKELKNLAAVIEEQSGTHTSNFLGFAQRARESGTLLGAIKSMTQADVGPIIREGGSTVAFALGMSHVITNPKNIRYAASLGDPKVPEPIKYGIFRNLVHQYDEYQKAQEASLTPEDKERLKGRSDNVQEYKDTLKAVNK